MKPASNRLDPANSQTLGAEGKWISAGNAVHSTLQFVRIGWTIGPGSCGSRHRVAMYLMRMAPWKASHCQCAKIMIQGD
jgi:hypothetical protein